MGIRKKETPRSYIIKQKNGKIIRRNVYHLRPSINTFVRKRCSMPYSDDLPNNATEGNS